MPAPAVVAATASRAEQLLADSCRDAITVAFILSPAFVRGTTNPYSLKPIPIMPSKFDLAAKQAAADALKAHDDKIAALNAAPSKDQARIDQLTAERVPLAERLEKLNGPTPPST